MSTLITLEYYGAEGTGPTLKAAKEDAGRKITRAMSGSYTPEIIRYRAYACLVYRTPVGWTSAIICDETGLRDRWGHTSETESKDDVVRAAKRHIAKLAWKPEDAFTPPPFLTDRNDVIDYQDWVRFQLRYKIAKRHGLTDCDAHYWACGSLGRPDLAALHFEGEPTAA